MSGTKRPYKEQRKIKAALRLAGMTAADAARRAGVSHGYVRLLLNGFARPSPALDAIGKIVGQKPER